MTSDTTSQVRPRPRQRRADGERTRRAILSRAASLATVDGLEGLSIGNLAAATGISKSGLYAHFGSKEELQLATVDHAASLFVAEVIEPAILPQARALLQKHLDAGDLVAIITATNRFVTAPIAAALGVEHLIAAMPEEDADGNLTGKLLGVPTSGAGKVAHTHAWLVKIGKPLSAFESSHFYSDSHNDIPLLSVVTHPVATNPNAALATHATTLGWPSLYLFND